MVENARIVVGTASQFPSVQKLSLFLFSTCRVWSISRHFGTSGQSKREVATFLVERSSRYLAFETSSFYLEYAVASAIVGGGGI